jgi:hypothetical protein
MPLHGVYGIDISELSQLRDEVAQRMESINERLGEKRPDSPEMENEDEKEPEASAEHGSEEPLNHPKGDEHPAA